MWWWYLVLILIFAGIALISYRSGKELKEDIKKINIKKRVRLTRLILISRRSDSLCISADCRSLPYDIKTLRSRAGLIKRG